MKFGSAHSALEKYIEYRLKDGDTTPSAFADLDKYKVLSTQRWICTHCYAHADIHTGQCEVCGGDLVVYRSASKARSSVEEEGSMSSRLDLVDFIVDFEKILKHFTSYEQNLLLYMGYGQEDTVVSYLLDKYDLKKTCENLNHLSDEINELKVKLEDLLYEADYLRRPNGATNVKRSKRKSESVARRIEKFASKVKS